jgi:hypothetical protein
MIAIVKIPGLALYAIGKKNKALAAPIWCAAEGLSMHLY